MRGEGCGEGQSSQGIAALSQTLPDRLIERVMPLSAVSRWTCALV